MKCILEFSRTVLAILLTIACVVIFEAPAVLAQNPDPVTPADRKWNYSELAGVPEKARARRNPLENDPDAVPAGGKLFENHCAECHGMKAEGGKRGPSLIREEVQQATPGAIFWILSNGVVWHGMPDWSKLPEPQRWQITAFLKSFKTSSGPQAAGRAAQGR